MKTIPYRYGIVNKSILTDPELSIQSKGLYSILCTYADSDRKCYPSISLLADISSKSTAQISNYIKELKNKNYVRRQGRYLILK